MGLSFLCLLSDKIESHIHRISGSCLSCLSCGYSCPAFSDMVKHVEARHLNSKNYPCTLCEQAFTTPHYRQRHYKLRHDMNISAKQIKEMAEKVFRLKSDFT